MNKLLLATLITIPVAFTSVPALADVDGNYMVYYGDYNYDYYPYTYNGSDSYPYAYYPSRAYYDRGSYYYGDNGYGGYYSYYGNNCSSCSSGSYYGGYPGVYVGVPFIGVGVGVGY